MSTNKSVSSSSSFWANQLQVEVSSNRKIEECRRNLFIDIEILN